MIKSVPLKPKYTRLLFSGTILCLCTFPSFSQAPANDNCANAIALSSSSTCTNTAGTVVNATLSSGVPAACSGTARYDVWYSFVAATGNPTITLSSVGSNFLSPKIQILSGTCGALSSLGCSTGLSLVTSGLIAGNTYYVRIYSTAGLSPSSNGGFNICIKDPPAAIVDYGKSFVNISKGSKGGTVNAGDTLQIRATFVVKSGTAYYCSYSDNIPANTTYIPGTLQVLTNEGKVYQQFSDALDGDAGNITAGAITINLGTGATSSTGGTVSNTNKPSFYGGACIMVASYSVVVNAVPFGTTISIGNGTLNYFPNVGMTSPTTITFPAVNLVVYPDYGMCNNVVGANAILSENGGTFGSGSLKDRGPSSSIPASYTYANFSSSTGMPNDYYYGISNNTSGGSTVATGYSILNTWAKPDNSSPTHRIFSVWDIIGDHTGASNPLLGNPATDDNSGLSGGYMAVINSAYKTDTAFLDTVYNLCPNTYYQYSAWIRNICSKCGCDSNGKGASSSGYIPTGPGDSSGVHPNLTFNINGQDYYTSGDIPYTGQWVQKGLTYLTGPTQTSMVVNIQNNAPGGGGNDWAIDDITVATCSPNIALTPNKPDTLCQGSDDSVIFKVSSYFANYTEWLLQQSTDGGVTWTTPGNDTTGAASTGSATPVYDSSTKEYEYTIKRYYQISTADSVIKFKLVVASTANNLTNGNCATTNSAVKTILGINCLRILPTSFIYFKGIAKNGQANLQWLTSNETGNSQYIIERSEDNLHFVPIGTEKGMASLDGNGSYVFTDPKPIGTQTYYRINLSENGQHKYSTVALLSNTDIHFGLGALTNPFSDWLAFQLTVPGDGTAVFTILDMYGRMVRQQTQGVGSGLNSIDLYNLGTLQNGNYILQVQFGGQVINKQILKLSN